MINGTFKLMPAFFVHAVVRVRLAIFGGRTNRDDGRFFIRYEMAAVMTVTHREANSDRARNMVLAWLSALVVLVGQKKHP